MPEVTDASERVTVPEPVMEPEPSVAVRPGEVELDRLTVPLKLFSPVMVIVVVPGVPALKERLVGETVIVKSTTLTFTSTEWRSNPLVAVTLTT